MSLTTSVLHRLINAMSLIAEKPKLLDRIFVTKEYNPYGFYGLQICVDGEWVDVIVDHKLPCDHNHNLIFAKVSIYSMS